ncbi:MAG: putative transporter, periplasmic component YrbD [Collimonas fungivorans]|uniref:outer membrane lipid asymmetry maintenance protein MlaD n=1 Tax=Collimonas fungivorans TaxID=158899 RepID=UPI0026EB58D3|nr:outer membrane lipid asymmetry maintenance protein MlaD [Collimonas fungivorans]MDB5768647.1 putative transporter, periplasmic component YrbD [Collimonas fungivorans]
MQQKTVDVWVGIFVLIGVLALGFLALRAGNLSSATFNKTYPVITKFDNIGGLKVRASVRSAGVVVGRVASINFDDKNFQAIVTLNMDQRYQFPEDSSAKILTAGLLGEQYIGIEAGGATKNLAAGDRIKLTQSAIVLENLISQFLYSKAADVKDTEQ